MFSLPVFGPPSMICVNPLSVTGLISRLQSTVIASRAPGTTDAYRRAFTRWKNFASSVDEVKVFPARTEHMASGLPSASSGYDPFSFCCRLCLFMESNGLTVWRGYLPLLTVLLTVLRRFFALCMAILLFMTLMLLSKLLIEDRSTKEGQRRGFISKFIPRCLPSLDLIFKRLCFRA